MRASTLWDLVWAKGAEKPWQPRRTDMPLVFISLGGSRPDPASTRDAQPGGTGRSVT
jgi:hypothetical protein